MIVNARIHIGNMETIVLKNVTKPKWKKTKCNEDRAKYARLPAFTSKATTTFHSYLSAQMQLCPIYFYGKRTKGSHGIQMKGEKKKNNKQKVIEKRFCFSSCKHWNAYKQLCASFSFCFVMHTKILVWGLIENDCNAMKTDIFIDNQTSRRKKKRSFIREFLQI